MLTHEQLEVAARKLCELHAPYGDKEGHILLLAADDVRWIDRVMDAIVHARGETAGEQRKNVPREPTEAMTRAGLYWADHGGTVQDAWRAMWDAYQEPTK